MLQGCRKSIKLFSIQFSAIFIVSWVNLAAQANQIVTNQLLNVDFQLGQEKEGVLIIDLASSAALVDFKRENRKLIIELHDTKISDDKLVILNVDDFSTVVSRIETFRERSSTILSVEVNDAYQYDYDLINNQVKVIVSKPNKLMGSDDHLLNNHKNKPISINFQDISVRHVLQLIADYNDFNLVVSDSVEGNLTLRLDGVPWQQV